MNKLQCYQCGHNTQLCKDASNRIFCNAVHQQVYLDGWTRLLTYVNNQKTLRDRVWLHLGIKRSLVIEKQPQEDEPITLLQLEFLPSEMLNEILLFSFPNVGTDVEQTQEVLRMRWVNLRLQDIIDNYILANVLTLSSEVASVLDNETLLLFSRVRRLALRGVSAINDDGISRMTRLEQLHLFDNPGITERGLNPLTTLHELVIRSNNEIEDSALSTLTNLDRLILLEVTSLTDKGLCYLPQLRELFIQDSLGAIDGSGFRCFTKLEQLGLGRTAGIMDDGLASLAPTLKKLYLSNNSDITYRSVSRLTRLELLFLDSDRTIPDRALLTLTNLGELSLDNNTVITDLGLSNLTRLHTLNLSNNYTITPAGLMPFVATLEKIVLPANPHIRWIDLVRFPRLKEVAVRDFKDLASSKSQAELEKERGIKFIRY